MPIVNGKYQHPEGILKDSSHNKEYYLHRACIDYISGRVRSGKQIMEVKRPFPQLWDGRDQNFSHNYQGRSAEEGFFLKQLGLRRGVFDIHLWPGFHIWIEIKVTTGLTPEQRQYQKKMEGMGDKTGVAHSVAEFRDLLIGFGLPCEQPVVKEPELTAEEKHSAAMAMMQPIE